MDLRGPQPLPDTARVPRPAVVAPGRSRGRDAVTGAAAGAALGVLATLGGVPELLHDRVPDLVLPSLVVGALLGATPLRRWLLATAAALALLLALVVYTPILERPTRRLVRADPPPGVAPGAVVVLGGGITTDGLLYGQSLDRLLSGMELMQRESVPLLVLPGNTRWARGREVSAAADQRRLLRLAGVDSTRVLVARGVHSTRDEAVRVKALLFPRGIRRVSVVTSPVHSWRACRTFERVGFTVHCVPSASRDLPVRAGAPLRPADRLQAFRLWSYEQVAAAMYHLRGWI